jgi:hypothetical protein
MLALAARTASTLVGCCFGCGVFAAIPTAGIMGSPCVGIEPRSRGCIVIGPVDVGLLLGILNTASTSVTKPTTCTERRSAIKQRRLQTNQNLELGRRRFSSAPYDRQRLHDALYIFLCYFVLSSDCLDQLRLRHLHRHFCLLCDSRHGHYLESSTKTAHVDILPSRHRLARRFARASLMSELVARVAPVMSEADPNG